MDIKNHPQIVSDFFDLGGFSITFTPYLEKYLFNKPSNALPWRASSRAIS